MEAHNHRGWGISSIESIHNTIAYYLVSRPNKWDFIQIPFASINEAKDWIDEHIDFPERFNSITLKRWYQSKEDEL